MRCDCERKGLQRPLKGEKDDVYRAVRTINAMENLKVLPVRYEQFLVAHKYHTCERIWPRNTCFPDLIGPKPILNCQRNRAFHIALGKLWTKIESGMRIPIKNSLPSFSKVSGLNDE